MENPSECIFTGHFEDGGEKEEEGGECRRRREGECKRDLGYFENGS